MIIAKQTELQFIKREFKRLIIVTQIDFVTLVNSIKNRINMNVIITYEGFKNEWTGEILENCILHHGNLNPKDDYIFGWDYWVEICKSYVGMGYKNIRAILTDSDYKISEWSSNPKSFREMPILFYEPKEKDLMISF